MEAVDLLPFRFRRTTDGNVVAVSVTGDFAYLNQGELEALVQAPQDLDREKAGELQSKYFWIRRDSPGISRLLASRISARHSALADGPSLFIIVPTLECAHSCGYCQVSRSIGSQGHSLSVLQIEQACKSIAMSAGATSTVEFQGGDPLIRFDLVQHAIVTLANSAELAGRRPRFVIASTLHQLTNEICDFLAKYDVQLSTSIDGPRHVHDVNRPTPGRNSYEGTVRGLRLARDRLGARSVAALTTITRAALAFPEQIVDEYVELGLSEVSLRPISPYGFARKARAGKWPTVTEYARFYRRALERVIHWNRSGRSIREGQAAIVLNKLLSPIDRGYVDLQAIPAGGSAALVFNYDGFVYPSDEARMLAETGITAFRLGTFDQPIDQLRRSQTWSQIRADAASWRTPGCDECAYASYCSPDVTMNVAEFGVADVPASWSEHCDRAIWLFDYFLDRLKVADAFERRLFQEWARPDA